MAQDLCRFNLLLVTEGYGYIDTIGMMIYTRCPNYNLYFATTVTDAVSKTRHHNPDVFIVDEALLKLAAFREFEEVVKKRGAVVFHLTGAETYGRPVRGAATTHKLPKTISGEDLEKRLATVAEELFWRKLSFARVVIPR